MLYLSLCWYDVEMMINSETQRGIARSSSWANIYLYLYLRMMRNILPIWGQIIQTCRIIWFSWLLSEWWWRWYWWQWWWRWCWWPSCRGCRGCRCRRDYDSDDIDGNNDDDYVDDQVVEIAEDVDAEEMTMVMILMTMMMMSTKL